jgi:hypothetical protein
VHSNASASSRTSAHKMNASYRPASSGAVTSRSLSRGACAGSSNVRECG